MAPSNPVSATHDIPVLDDDALVIPLDVLERIRRLFEFLRRLEEKRASVRRDLSASEWTLFLSELPSRPEVRLRSRAGKETDTAEILALRRPELTPCPAPPETLEGWLKDGWEHPNQTDVVSASRSGRGRASEVLEADAKRAKDARSWTAQRAKWAQSELPVRAVAEAFDRALALWARLQREGERLRLLLGDGHLLWQHSDGTLRHPLLLEEVELRFDETKREILFLDAGAPPRLYAELLGTLPEVDGEKRKACRAIVDEALERGELLALESAQTEGILSALASVLSAPKAILPEGSNEGPGPTPKLARAPVLFLVPRTVGLGGVYEAFLQRLGQLPSLPKGLALAVGDVNAAAGAKESESEADLYFTKPANEAQKRIARRMDATGAVLVQGPPGTGKTHTIANLIGHFLAQGKKVLVTAQTSRALRVLRDQVVEPLKPLCVSVLDSDMDSRDELESAINGIVTKLNVAAFEYERAAAAAEKERRDLLRRLEQRQSRLREALRSGVSEIVIGEQRFHPNAAAELVAEGRGKHDWILGPLAPDARLPLTEEALKTLYKLNADISAADEAQLRAGFPTPMELLAPETLAKLQAKLDAPLPTDPGRWASPWGKATAEQLSQLVDGLRERVEWMERQPEWVHTCAQAILLGGPHAEPWEELLAKMEGTAPRLATLKKSLFDFDVAFDEQLDPEESLVAVREMLQHLAQGGGLGWLTLAGKGHWRKLLDRCTVNGRKPEAERELRALETRLTMEQLRRQLRRHWDVVLGAAGLPLEEGHRSLVEEAALARAQEVRRAVRWAKEDHEASIAELTAVGVPWAVLLEKTPSKPPHAELRRVLTCIRGFVLPGMTLELAQQERVKLEWQLKVARENLAKNARCDAAVKALTALEAVNLERYREAYEELSRLHKLRGLAALRERLISTLWAAAPTWAERVRARVAPHEGPDVPGDVQQAWHHRLLMEELERRSQEDVDALQREVTELSEEVQRITSVVVENRAWAAQSRRTDAQQHRALMSWIDVVKRLGKGYSKRAEEFRSSARKQLEVARSAVPVWIMPLSRVAESFGPDQPLFDVVILDEASQCDVSALIAFALGQRVVVVGDDEQVSPLAIGEGSEDVRELQREWLDGFPDRDLFDGKASAYEIARRSFPGGLIRLTEHFRCVPDIIAFSNMLCYDGEIRPLREAASAHVFPAIVPHRVEGGVRDGSAKVNRAEALEIAALVVAVTEQREYDGLELGVISLLGAEQSKEIDALLQRVLDPAEYKSRRLVCGTAPHFQGDERDVIFLSMVDSGGDGGPLRLLDRDEMRKRYNVAVSRARDQLWVVHSLDVERHLKADDLRRRLLEHAHNPATLRRAALEEEPTAPSLLAQQLGERLVAKGYAVEMSVEVGTHRISLAVSGRGGRVALPCDGEQKTIAELDAQLQQEAVLARLGWKFIRVRGGPFFRDPEGETERIVRRLGQLGITPGTSELRSGVSRSHARVQEQLVKRAAVLRKQWLEDAGSLDALFAGGSGGKGAKSRWKGPATRADTSAARTLIMDISELG